MSRSVASKRKRTQEESEFEPDVKKRRLGMKFKPLETYDIEDIKQISKNLNKEDSMDIDNGFTLIPPKCLLIKLTSTRQFHKISNKVNDLCIELDAAKRPEKLNVRAAFKFEVFVTGGDVELEVDDPNDESHYLYVGSFAVSTTTDSKNIVLRAAKPLTAKAVSKLGNHVVDNEENEQSADEDEQAGSGALSTKARTLIKNLDKVPKLVAPKPLPGKYSDLDHTGLSTHGHTLTGSAHTWDLTDVGRALMNADCPVTAANVVFFETAAGGHETFIAGVAHSRVTELCLMGGSVNDDPSAHAMLFASMLVTSNGLKKLSFRHVSLIAFNSFCAGLNACSSLETLILSHCDVNDNRLPTLVSVLCNPNSKLKLKQLNLSGNTFTSASAEWIQYLLEHNKTLEGISFSENEVLKEDFGTYLGKGLAKNKTLKRIHFNKTKLGAKGAAAMLKEMTGVNNTLELLNFEMCKIGKFGGDALAEFLQKNNSLQHLHLGSTGIVEKTWPTLLKVMESKANLRSFVINKPDERVGDVNVASVIAASPKLKDMRLSFFDGLCGEEMQ